MLHSLIRRLFAAFGIYLHRGPFIAMDIRQMDNLLHYDRMFSLLGDKEGNVVECGVGRGRSFLYLNYLMYRSGKRGTLWGFDSFEGFPEPSAADRSPRNPKRGEWAGFTLERMRGILRTAGFPPEWIEGRVRLVKGFFSESLGRYDGAPIALLHIDADLYESYRDALWALFPRVMKGGLVLFDEYNRENWPGATKAVNEYFKGSGEVIRKDERSGKYYLIKRGA